MPIVEKGSFLEKNRVIIVNGRISKFDNPAPRSPNLNSLDVGSLPQAKVNFA